jgi:hypothetical protein
MSSADRNLRNLAAWGYESNDTGTRLEVDVWTVNPTVEPEDDALDRARGAFASEPYEAIEAFGNVARVRFPGIDTTGYRYIDMAETNPGKTERSDANQQAFAGAKRSAGGSRDAAGRQTEGYTAPDDAPDLEACAAHGWAEVIPEVRRDLRRSGARELAQAAENLTRDGRREEEEEPTAEAVTDGFENAVRIFPKGGEAFEYSVDVTRGDMDRDGGGPS